MLLLSMDTSTPEGSVALVNGAPGGGEVWFAEEFRADRSHNSLLFGPLGRAVEEVRRRGVPVAGIVVGTGPGSYTGIRIGIAAARGLAVVLNLPVAGWNSFASLEPGGDFHVLGDARRGEFFLARVVAGRMAGEVVIFPADELQSRMKDVRGTVYAMEGSVLVEDALPGKPSAVGLAQVFAEEFSYDVSRAFGGDRSGPIEPLYLRAPYFTQAADEVPPTREAPSNPLTGT